MAKKFSEKEEALMRIVVGVVSGIILYVWFWLILVLAIINFFITLFSGKRKENIARFSEYWNTETYKFSRYITFVSNIRPFPFTNIEEMSKFK
mgnify:FL=1